MLIHALVTGEVSKREREALEAHPWSISAIVLWELAKLVQLGRLELDLASPELRQALAHLHVWPMTLEIVLTSTRLDFKSDPADELIAATCIVERVPLFTRDKRIRRSKLVPLA